MTSTSHSVVAGAATRPGAAPAPDQGEQADEPPAPPSRRQPRLAVLGLAVALAVPLVVALAAVAEPRWYPSLDYAMTEALVQDVGGGHTPMVGLPGRLGRGISLDAQGNHPGPLSFWSLAPAYRLLGSSPWALQAATTALNGIALGVAVWLAHRRAGLRVALGVATGLAFLTHAYGPDRLAEPWNPYLPLMWWVVFLLAVWSVLGDDLRVLPVAVFAGCFCVHTHVSYLGLVGGLGAVTGGVLAWRLWRDRADPAARRGRVRWLALSAGLLVALWVTPVVDQFTQEPGNLGVIADTFAHSPEEAAGFGGAVGPWLSHLDLWGFLTGQQDTQGSVVPGTVLLVVWLAAVVATARWLRHADLLRLHAVVAAALVLGLVSIAQAHGALYGYLMLWVWGSASLLLVATGWTAALGLQALAGPSRRVISATTVVVAVALAVGTLLRVDDARSLDPPAAGQSRVLDQVVPAVATALDGGTVPGTGREGRYVLAWSDPVMPPSLAHSLRLELDRRGFDVAFDERAPMGMPRHRTIAREEATAQLVIVAGRGIEEWRDQPEAVEIAHAAADPDDVAALQRLRRQVRRSLDRPGLRELRSDVDRNLLGLMANPRTPERVRKLLQDTLLRPNDLAEPVAVFVVPGSRGGGGRGD